MEDHKFKQNNSLLKKKKKKKEGKEYKIGGSQNQRILKETM